MTLNHTVQLFTVEYGASSETFGFDWACVVDGKFWYGGRLTYWLLCGVGFKRLPTKDYGGGFDRRAAMWQDILSPAPEKTVKP